VTTVVLAFVRAFAALTMLPVWGDAVPRWVSGLAALGLAALVWPGLPGEVVTTPGDALRAVALELLFGMATGLIVRASFSALALAAEVAAQQSGYGAVTLMDPVTAAQESPYGVLATLLGTAVFLASGLHLELVGALAESFRAFPPGGGGPLPVAVPQLVAASVALGVQMSGPLLVGGLLLQLFIGLLTKVAPRLQAFFAIGPTLTAAAGLWLFALTLPWLLSVHTSAVATAVQQAGSVLTGR
jgi:flagellar biosynthetic protein FliR